MERFDSLAWNIVHKGLNGVDFSMLSEKLKKEVLEKAAELFLKEDKPLEAVRALKMCNSKNKLIEYGNYFLSLNRFIEAAHAFIEAGDEKKMEDVAGICLREEMYDTARLVYEKLNKKEMVEYITTNFRA